MKIILVAINAKYIHSSLAVYSLYSYLSEEEKQHVEIQEFTTNQSEEFIVSELFRKNPDVLAFSCYIWNIGMVASIVETFKKVLPHVPIIAGGPEVSYDESPPQGIDIVVRGEGEAAFKQLVRQYCGIEPLNTDINTTCSTQSPPLENIPFPYITGFDNLKNRIIYYETSRGCINRCGYCLSSVTEGVRFLPLERIKSDLDKFIAAGVKQVKFVDRTFNCSKHHAMAIWEYLIKTDNGTTNFHFEIAGELLDQEMLALLSLARKGLFQFEIGVQSTNPKTLKAINRTTDTALLLDNVQKLKLPGNIHLHLDLIVGLPFEDYQTFAKSFNDVFVCYPHKLQVGFLKLLKGSQLRIDAKKYGIKFKESAPYSVLKTDFINFAEVNHISKIEHMVESFYNATGFYSCVRFMLAKFSSPFEFFDALAEYWEAKDYHMVSHKKSAMYSFLHAFGKKFIPDEIRPICELLKFDMLKQDNIRTFPAWIDEYYFPDNRQITRTTAVHTFEYDICAWLDELKHNLDAVLHAGGVSVAFDYAQTAKQR